jgi:HEAT repeat protein
MIAGDTKSAIEKLEALRQTEADNPHLYFYLGGAYLQQEAHEKALDAYIEAIRHEPRYSDDEVVAQNLRALLAEESKIARRSLGALLAEHDLPRLRTTLAALARDPQADDDARQAAYAALERAGQLEELDPWERHAVAMMGESKCKERRTHLEKLVELGDEQALPVVRYFHEKPKRGCGLLNLRDCQACMRSELERAVETLSGNDSGK